MKLFKLIKILKDKDNWFKDSYMTKYYHKPTGIYYITGITFYNSEGQEIYSEFFGSSFILPFYTKAIEKHITNRNGNNLDKIYQNWIDNKEVH